MFFDIDRLQETGRAVPPLSVKQPKHVGQAVLRNC